MTQSPNSVEGKIHYHQIIICLTFSLPSLIVKYYKASFTHYNLIIIQRKHKLSLQYYINIKKILHLRHIVLKKKSAHALPLTTSQENELIFAKSPPCLKRKVYSPEEGRIRNSCIYLLLHIYLCCC